MGNLKVAAWLKELPSAPEYHPTEEEFQDPIAYIMRIEQEACKYGICKIVPPFGKESKKEVLFNLNRSLVENQNFNFRHAVTPCRSMLGRPTPLKLGRTKDAAKCLKPKAIQKGKLSTRLQMLGTNVSSHGGTQFPAQKMVWETGKAYTLEQYEAKAKHSAEEKLSRIKRITPLVLETLFWKAVAEKPTYVEYANDIPGTAFANSLVDLMLHKSIEESDSGFDTGCQANCLKVDSKIGSSNSASFESDVCNGSSASSPGKADFVGRESLKEKRAASRLKLANSPWNIRHFARSPGSLLRFLPDEVPGVTSPMVYLGMLFSWFAWHIEDHELHSINYLHMGHPKTWYAVPTTAAKSFEEVVRVVGYGGLLDSRAALELLGAKTTIMSPEALLAAGLPCCRLVQNAGDYVVTFPRAYHLGFSHGFNCGEAANFATPFWLNIAKDAAMRRASMNHLPMLSHEQLLYSMAMSISLSQRLGNNCSGEYEIKKMFVKDVMQSNDMIFSLLGSGLLKCIILKKNQDVPVCAEVVNPSMTSNTHTDTFIVARSEKGSLSQPVHLNISIYEDTLALNGTTSIESLCDSHHTADKTSCSLQYDWGTLPCNVCGILSFATFAIIKPSSEASSNLTNTLEGHEVLATKCGPQLPMAKRFKYCERLENCSIKEWNTGDQICCNLRNCTNVRSACPSIPTDDVKNSSSDSLSDDSTLSGAQGIAGQFTSFENGLVTLLVGNDRGDLRFKDERGNNLSTMCSSDAMNSFSDNSNQLSSLQSLAATYEDETEPEDCRDATIAIKNFGSHSDDLLRPHIFCLEHALRVQKELQDFGGSDGVVVCNSRYKDIQEQAKYMANHVNIMHTWKEYPLSEALPDELKLLKDLGDNMEGENQPDFNWVTLLPMTIAQAGVNRANVSMAGPCDVQSAHSMSDESNKSFKKTPAARKRKKELPHPEVACQKVKLREISQGPTTPLFPTSEENEQVSNSSKILRGALEETVEASHQEKCLKIVIRFRQHPDGHSTLKHREIQFEPKLNMAEKPELNRTDENSEFSDSIAVCEERDKQDTGETGQRSTYTKGNQEPCEKSNINSIHCCTEVRNSLSNGYYNEEHEG